MPGTLLYGKDVILNWERTLTSKHLQRTVGERNSDKILGAPVPGRGGTQPCKICSSSDLLVSGKRPPKTFSLGSISSAEGSRETLSTSHKRVSEPVPSLLSPEPQLEYTARLDFLWRVQAKEEINEMKAARLYKAIEETSIFQLHAQKDSRSLMNVTFRTGDADLDKKFVAAAAERGMVSLAGHRKVGGMRASIYNAMPVEGVEKLAAFIKEFDAAGGNI